MFNICGIAYLGLLKQGTCVCDVNYVWYRYSGSLEIGNVYVMLNMCGIATLGL